MRKSVYRPEIDGLRAIAVFLVLFFHAGVPGFSGGFVGVDVFFVISGFLITQILLREMNKGAFSFWSFWERRIRRIFPALVTVLLTSLVVANKVLLFPTDFTDFLKSLFAQSLFLSNVFFFRKVNYFADPAEAMPLLHTWSLAVEEQFYIVYPVLLFLCWRYARKYLAHVLFAIALTSLVYCVYLVNLAPGTYFSFRPLPDALWWKALNNTAGFFLLPARAWELLIGGIFAVLASKVNNSFMAELLSVSGLLLIMFSAVHFTSGTLFPGAAALLPTFGCLAIIAANANAQTFVGKILSLKPLVWLGLISYPLYLWHWPVLVFSDIVFLEMTPGHTFGLIILSIVLAWITYVLIEQPIRNRELLSSRKLLFSAACLTLLILGGLGYGLQSIRIQERLTDDLRMFLSADQDLGPRYMPCYRRREVLTEGPCLLGSSEVDDRPIDFLVWGDSHASVVLDTVDALAQEADVKGAFIAASGCIPVAHLTSAIVKPECQKTTEYVFKYLDQHQIKKLLIAGRWNYYTNEQPGLLFEQQKQLVQDILSPEEVTVETARQAFALRFGEMIKELRSKGVDVYVIKQVPENQGFDKRKVFYSALKNGDELSLGPIPIEDHVRYTQWSNAVIDDVVPESHVIDPAKVLCKGESCTISHNGVFIYRDNDHLNFTGANLLAPLLDPFLQRTNLHKLNTGL